jgi:hypothetical protein
MAAREMNADIAEHKAEAREFPALEQANPSVLRMALYQATRDPELEAMRLEKKSFWGGAFEFSVVGEEHVERIKEKTRAFLRGGARNQGPAPTEAELREMMELLGLVQLPRFLDDHG